MKRNILACVVVCLMLGCTGAWAAESFAGATLGRLAALAPGQSLVVNDFPAGGAATATLRFKRVQVYAPGAVIYAVGADGRHEVPRSTLVFLRGYSPDRSIRVALALHADGRFASGSGENAHMAFVLEAGAARGGQPILTARSLESSLPAPDAFQYTCGNASIDLLQRRSPVRSGFAARLEAAMRLAGVAQTTQAIRDATVAIDTDSKFMERLFADDTSAASDWIAGMFNAMNVMYVADLDVRLLVGTTFLRIDAGSDPYTGLAQETGASVADLNLFGEYWRTHYASVPRSFAALLSGAISSDGGGCSAAGIAWIDQYCQNGFRPGGTTVGSYSVTKVCTNINVDPNGAFDARIVGHEIGHNFGADHTHCTDATTGQARVASNTIDQCYNGEAGLGCYSGATSCPSSGPGAPLGTIMSYCHINGCGSSIMQFHPTQVTKVLLPEIAAQTPSCLTLDSIFFNGFD